MGPHRGSYRRRNVIERNGTEGSIRVSVRRQVRCRTAYKPVAVLYFLFVVVNRALSAEEKIGTTECADLIYQPNGGGLKRKTSR
jgi:hypothetical protein